MKPKAYIETTFISYLTAYPSRDIIVAAHQQITHEWWSTRKEDFDLFVSQLVWDEAKAGDQEMSQRRLAVLETVELLEVTEEGLSLANELVDKGPLPQKAAEDAIHIATAVINGMDYLLTWNCSHLANAAMRSKIEQICRTKGYEPTIICTPEELLEK
jgi:predicted nucleic acid-binding protein